MKDRYTLVVDGKVVATANHIPYLKKQGDMWLDELNAYVAKIYCYNKERTYRFYNGKWHL